MGSPPAFKGDPDVWCPEDLLIGALNSCLMLTFLSVSRRRGLQVVAYESSAQGTLEHIEGQYRVTRVEVHPVVLLNADIDFAPAREAMQETLETCMITNSIRATVDLIPQFRERTASSGQRDGHIGHFGSKMNYLASAACEFGQQIVSRNALSARASTS